jgi:hypothetical protein
MASKQLTALDIFTALSPAEKRKALKVLQQAEQTPCEAKGHRFKAVDVIARWFEPCQTKMVCTACGKVVIV